MFSFLLKQKYVEFLNWTRFNEIGKGKLADRKHFTVIKNNNMQSIILNIQFLCSTFLYNPTSKLALYGYWLCQTEISKTKILKISARQITNRGRNS